MSKLLRKALKSAILPASLLVTGKFISVFFLISYLGAEFSVSNDVRSFFSIQLSVNTAQEALFVNSYSNLFTLLLIAIPTLYMIIRYTLLKDAQNNPKTIVKLTKLNILKWVTGQESNLVKMIIWTSFLWVVSGVCISSSITLQTFNWVGILAGVLTLISTWGLIRTFEEETARIYPDESSKYL